MNLILNIATSKFDSALSIIRLSLGNLNYFNSKFIIFKLFKNNIRNNFASLNNLYYKNKILDKVIVVYYKKPNSFTGLNLIEINLHGNYLYLKYVLIKIKFYLKKFKIRLSFEGEFSKLAFINNKLNVYNLKKIFYSNNRNFNIIKLNLSKKLNNLYLILNNIKLFLINYNNFDYKFINLRLKILYFKKFFSNLIFFFKKKKLNNINLYLLGLFNTGKSTLLNKILKNNFSLISSIKGTTNNINFKSLDLKFKLLNIYDTPGFCNTYSIIEKFSIKFCLKKIKFSNIIIFIFKNVNFYNIFFYYIKTQFGFNIFYIFNKIDIFFFNKPSFEILFYFNIRFMFKLSSKNYLGLCLLINEIKLNIYVYNNFLNINFFNIKIIYFINKNLLNFLFVKNKNFIINIIYILKKNINLIINNKKNKNILNFFNNFCIGK